MSEPCRRRLAWAMTGSGHYLRECLGLDSAVGFAALRTIAQRSDDPLAAPAGALMGQLLEQYPELAGVARCPA